MEPTSSHIFSNSTLVEILDDLCVRFIVNLPEEELSSIERICFQIEEAQWYFEDFIREMNPSLPTLPLRTFLSKIFAVCPLPLLNQIPPERAENAFAEFMAYKTRVPVRGAILLNDTMDRCVLVKGWKSGASWSFPRGKINKDEKDEDCAVREVLEETGYSVEGRVRSDHFVEVTMREQNMRLYIIPGVPEETRFEPRTRKEISKIAWHKFSDLPTFSKKRNQQNPQQSDGRTGRYYMVAPFLKELRKWISTSGKQWLQEQKQMPPPVALIGEETEVEEDTPAPPADPHAESRIFLGPPNNGTMESDLNTNAVDTTANDEANAKLKNFLDLSGPTKKPEEDSSTKLKNLLNIGVPAPQPNPKALLSILKGGNGTTATVTPQSHPPPQQRDTQLTPLHHTAPAAHSPPVPIPGYYYPPPPAHLGNPMVGLPPHIGPPTDQSTQLAGNVNGSSQAQQTGWSPFSQGHPEPVPYLPSPPPTSLFPAPQHIFNSPPANHPMNGFPPPPPFGQLAFTHQNHGEHAGFLNKLMGQHPPPTPLEAFMPPPVPSKPPDPGQAGTLLSILKGATPAPPETSPARMAESSSAPYQSHQQQPINLQAPPTPKVLRSQHKNNLLETLRASAINGTSRPGSDSPAAPPVAPPPRPISAEVTSGSAVSGIATSVMTTPPPKTLRHPVPSATPLPTSFDRRQSVSNEQAQRLLAMFKGGATTPPVPISREGSIGTPSPEQVKPVTVRDTSFARKVAQKSPLGRERDGLLAYLETVAKEGGQ